MCGVVQGESGHSNSCGDRPSHHTRPGRAADDTAKETFQGLVQMDQM